MSVQGRCSAQNGHLRHGDAAAEIRRLRLRSFRAPSVIATEQTPLRCCRATIHRSAMKATMTMNKPPHHIVHVVACNTQSCVAGANDTHTRLMRGVAYRTAKWSRVAPCGHARFCVTCVDIVVAMDTCCPIYRADIEMVMRVYN